MRLRHVMMMVSLMGATGLAGTLHAQEPPKFDTGMIPSQHIFLPDGEADASVFLISDTAGWSNTDEQEAKALVEKGAAVVGIDFPSYLAALRKDDGDCIYMISDVEALAQQIQRATGNSSYRPPIIAGIGEGGALALAMIAQSPVATIGEAVAVDPAAGIPLTKQLCTPASKEQRGDRMVYGLTDGELPAGVTVLFSKSADQDGRDHVAALTAAHPDIEVQDIDDAPADALLQTLSDRGEASGDADNPLGLPLTVLETAPKFDTMAVVYSGDGGWRDIDKEIGGALQSSGIPTVGVDSLRYFWSERKPQDVADDLTRIIDTYRHQWHVKHVLLVGYSFGADVLPATYNLLTDKEKQHIAQISLLAVSHEVDYEVSVSGWLGVAGDGSAGDPASDIRKIDPALVQCFYGTDDDDDDACPTLKDTPVEIIPVDGGHHFDGDYEALAKRITDGLTKRLGR